jgi:rod shape-determining protein MreC
MELLNRYRNITVLLLVIFAQLVLVAYQVKSNQDVRLIRVWAVTGVTPLARLVEGVRSTTVSNVDRYVSFHDLAEENRKLKSDLGKLKLENEYLKAQLGTADRAVALSAFQARSPSKTVASRVIGTGTGASSRVVFIDRGSGRGVMRGMAVITPDGIVGKVIAAYPTASQVLLIDDPTFAAGVISQKHRVRGTVRGMGQSKCMVDYIQNEEPVDQGEWFYTSGDDGVFPEGMPVGQVSAAHAGNPNKTVVLTPSGLGGGLEEVLVILEGVHQPVPEPATAATPVHLQAPPPSAEAAAPAGSPAAPAAATEADRMRARYLKIGEAQNHKFGEGLPGSKPPDFNLNPDDPAVKARAAANAAAAARAAELAKNPGAATAKPAILPPSAGAAATPGAAQPPAARPPSQPAVAKPAGQPVLGRAPSSAPGPGSAVKGPRADPAVRPATPAKPAPPSTQP